MESVGDVVFRSEFRVFNCSAKDTSQWRIWGLAWGGGGVQQPAYVHVASISVMTFFPGGGLSTPPPPPHHYTLLIQFV